MLPSENFWEMEFGLLRYAQMVWVPLSQPLFLTPAGHLTF